LISGTITLAVWHPHSALIAVATQVSDDKSRIINFKNSSMPLLGISPEGARGIAWNFKGDYLAVGDNDGQVLIYDEKGKLIRKFQNENTKSITAVAWHPKQNVLVTVSDKIRMFDIEGNLLKSIKHRKEDVLILSIAWHKSGKFFVTGDYGDGINHSLLQYWDEQGNLIRSIDKSKGEYRNLAWNKDGTRLASASDALRIWDTKGNLIAEGKSKSYLWGISWNRTGTKIITTSLDEEIIVWKSNAKKLRIVK
jgi:WD40 repeat protein